MPTTKPILFLLALLFLIVPASASTITYHESTYGQESSSEGYSDSSYVYGSQTEYLEGDITGYIKFNTAKPLGTPENAYVILGLQNTATGSYYGLASKQNLYGTWNVSFQRSGLPAGYYRQYMYLYCYEYDDDTKRITCTLLNETVVIDSQPEPEPEPESTLEFSKSEASPYSSFTYSWSLDPYYTGDLDEVYDGYTSTQSYYILFDIDHEESSLNDGEFLVVSLGSASGSGTLDTGDYYIGENYTLTGTLWHEATYYDMATFTGPIEESEFLDTAWITVSTSSSESSENSTEENNTEIEDPTLPELPDPFGNSSISDPNGTEVSEGGNYSYDPDENGTINATWITEYKQSVDNAYEPLDNGVSGFLEYVLWPITGFTGYLLTILLLATDILSVVLTMVMSVSVIMTSLFNAVPDKVLMVGSYALLLDIFAVVMGK